MDNVVKIFDNTIEYIPADKGLNYILCNELNEVFFGVYEVKIGDVVFIGESVDTIKDSPIVKIPIVIEDKEHDVLFALKKQDETGVILNLKSLSNGRKILLDEKKIVEEAAEEFELPLIEEVVEERVQQDSNATVDIEKYKTDALRVISENFKEKKAKIEQLQESLKTFIDNNIESIKESTLVDVDSFKNDIISSVETIVESNKIDTHSSIAEINCLKESIEASVNGYLVDLELTSAEKVTALENLREQVNFEVTSRLDEFKIDLEHYKKTTSDEFDNLKNFVDVTNHKLIEQRKTADALNAEALNQLEQTKEALKQLTESKLKLFQSIADKKQNSIAKIIENKLSDFVTSAEKVETQIAVLESSVTNKISGILDSFNESVKTKLLEITIAGDGIEKISKDKTNNIKSLADGIEKNISEKLNNSIREFNELVDLKITESNQATNLIRESATSETASLQRAGKEILEAVEAKVKGINLVAVKKEDLASLKKQLEERINNESANLKKYVSSYGGGGSVAQQFAAGGTMNGTLNVEGQILSGGVDLVTIFTGGGGGYQTLTFTESSAALTIAPFGNTVSLASLSGGGGITGDYLPLSGGTITGNLSVTQNVTVDSLTYSITPTITSSQIGQTYWNVDDNTITIDMGNDVLQEVGFKNFIEVKANGSNIDKGTVLWATSAVTSGNSGIIKANNLLADGSVPARFLIGVAAEDIISEGNGRSVTFGVLKGCNLGSYADAGETWQVGQILYPSPTISGGWTNIEPTAPNLAMPIAFILFINNGATKTNVSMMIRVDNGYDLDEIHDVKITSPSNGQVLAYTSSISAWENKTLNLNYLPLSGGTVNGNVTVIGTLSTTLLEATSANITYIDIKQYELSGFNVTGNVSISGSLSASGIVYGSSGNSDQWNTTYTTVQTNSATTWNYQGTDIKALTANWQSTYTTVSSNSANWLQTISFNESTAILSISNGNSVSLSALSGAAGITGDFLPLSGGTLTGAVSTNSDIEITDSTKGIILRSPNNTKYRITVTNAGELVTTPI